MVLKETLDAIRLLYGERLARVTVEKLVVGVFFTGIKLSTGHGGISYTPVSDLHGTGGKSREPMSQKAITFKGKKVSEILDRPEKGTFFTTLRAVALNALSEPLLREGAYSIVEDRDALDLIDLDSTRKVGMVGAIPPFITRLRKLPGVTIQVVEKKKGSFRQADRDLYVPASRAGEVLPFCDTVIITGASIANGTIDGLLKSVRPGAQVVVTGPTSSFLPNALFRRGVTLVSGVRVTDPDTALDMLQEGLIAWQLFEAGCLAKFNILNNPPAASCGKLRRGKETQGEER